MYSFKEKKKHFNALLNPDAAKYDLELLIQKQPNLPIISTYSRNSKRYANDILYSLLDYSTREEIREFRRSKMNTETMTVDPSTVDVTAQATTTVDSQTTPPVQTAGTPIDSSKVEEHEQPVTVTDSVGDTPQNGEGELQQQLEEAIERAEEAEANFEEAKEEAEARAEVAEEALEEEKKKEKSQAPVKSKSKKSTRKSTGTTSSTRKSK